MARTPVQVLSIGAGAALLVLALFGAVAFASVSRLAKQQEAVADVNGAIAQIDQVYASSADAERAATEFVMTGSPEANAAFVDAKSKVEDALDAVRPRVEDRPKERSLLDTLGPMLGERFTTLAAAIAKRKREGAAAAAVFTTAEANRSMRGNVMQLLNRMRDEELVLLAEKTRLLAKHGRTSKTVILVGSILAFVLSALVLTPVKPNMVARLTGQYPVPTPPGGTGPAP